MSTDDYWESALCVIVGEMSTDDYLDSELRVILDDMSAADHWESELYVLTVTGVNMKTKSISVLEVHLCCI
jgi:hypothetical protein